MTHDAATEGHLRDLDVAIDTAVSAQDGGTLDRLLADDFIYTHAGGQPEPKADFIRTVVARTDPPRRVLHAVNVEPHGDVGVTHGTIQFIYNDGRPDLYLEYVRVYREQSGRWSAISHRSFYPRDRG